MHYGKSGKSWNLHFLGLESREVEVWVMESYGKAINFLRMNRQKKTSKAEKITDKSEKTVIIRQK